MPDQFTNISDQIRHRVSFRDVFRELFPDDCRPKGNSHCPFHDDSDPSFQVEEDHGYCHAGCVPPSGNGKRWSVIDIWMKAKGMDFKNAVNEIARKYDIRNEVERNKKQEPVTVYDYTDGRGELLFQVCRFEPKDFRQRRPDGKGGYIWNLGETRRVLYRLPSVIESDTVWFCEGEKDADNVSAVGLCGTTSPQGAGKWKTLVQRYSIHEPLRRKIVLILPDNDKPGKDHALDIAETLTGFAASVKILELPGLPEKGDVSDFISIHGSDAYPKLVQIAENAHEFRNSREGPEIISCLALMNSPLSQPRWIIKGILPEGLSLLVAKPKAGKSWLCQNMALSIAQGTKALGYFLTEQCTTLNLCLEDNHRRMRERLNLILRGASPPENHLIACQWPSFDKGGIEHLQKTLKSTPDIKLITIDTFGRFRPRRGRVDDVYSSDYADLQELHSLATVYEIGIILVHHSRKETSEDAVDNILGSTALSGAADSLLILKRQSRMNSDAVLYVSGRDIPDQELSLSSENGIWTYKGNPLELRLTAERLEIWNILKDAKGSLTPTEIAKITGKTTTATHNLLSRMVDLGQIVKSERGRYSLPPEDKFNEEPWRGNPGESYSQEIVYLDHI